MTTAHSDHRRVLARGTILTLGPYDSSPRTARVSARAQMSEWGRTELADDVEAIVAELVTNAVRASEWPGTPIGFRLVLTATSVIVQVYDQASGVPSPPAAGEDAESGRGLLLVAALSREWGWTPTPWGKVVWAEIAA